MSTQKNLLTKTCLATSETPIYGRKYPCISLILPFYIISGSSSSSAPLLIQACRRIHQAYRPSTTSAHLLHFRTYLSFLIFMDLPITISVHNILTFLEYLYQSLISPKAIASYLSYIHAKASIYNLNTSSLSHPAITRFIRSININSKFSPTPKGVFDIPTLYQLSCSCDILPDPLLFRAIFLTAFFGFLRMSSIAPHSSSKFNPDVHFLRQDIIFAPPPPPRAHLLIKWTKTLQHHKAHHCIQ